ncbi:hypothetical protein MAR_032135 [Mya arenaria]|uniref:Reverse transcriptase domain-containing protein n=1 Tax=Mya arenaria TaxID=6604 RepID=A0ABY7F9S4_MYAAR|nr:hypothetical protein MAR_032135 [Mya arenaria]
MDVISNVEPKQGQILSPILHKEKIKLAEEKQKYFCFIWKGNIYQYTCIPNGVCEGPRLFTKLLKPVYSKLRNEGYVNSGFIDDSILMGDTIDECSKNVDATVSLMSKVDSLLIMRNRCSTHAKR